MRVAGERAQGLEPEFTAQPHPLSEELGILESSEAELSVAPDELGSHFLREAVDQGDLGARDVAELELALSAADADTDDAPGTDEEFVWTRLVELASQANASAELREAAEFGVEELEAERQAERSMSDESRSSDTLPLNDSIMYETSLLDREGSELGETGAPDVDLDDTGRHARVTARGALGEQIGDAPARLGARGRRD